MIRFPVILILLLSLGFCGRPSTVSSADEVRGSSPGPLLFFDGSTPESRILLPVGYLRPEASSESYCAYLRNLPLKPHGSPVLTYKGQVKPDRDIYIAVVDLPIGKRDLHQCADAVMRLRAEYLWRRGEFDKIHFNFTNGFRVDYLPWMEGHRIRVSGNRVSWVKTAEPSQSYEVFWKYLEIIFSYAGTLSLSQELTPVPLEDLQPGDLFIRGGSPGHAVLVIDTAVHKETGEKLFLLAQSYMPAQEIQILRNPLAPEISPWYRIPQDGVLITPEWRFTTDQLMRFPEE